MVMGTWRTQVVTRVVGWSFHFAHDPRRQEMAATDISEYAQGERSRHDTVSTDRRAYRHHQGLGRQRHIVDVCLSVCLSVCLFVCLSS